MPVLGVIFLRHATNRYQTALQTIEAAQAAGTMPKRPLVKGDFIKRRALMLLEVGLRLGCAGDIRAANTLTFINATSSVRTRRTDVKQFRS